MKVPRVEFPHYDSEGIYNATVAQLARMTDNARPALLDYRYPGGAADGTAASIVPPIWVSVVGERGLYPLAVFDSNDLRDPKESEKKNPSATGDEARLYHAPYAQSRPDVADLLPRLDSTWIGVYLALAGTVIIGSIWYLWAFLAPRTGKAGGGRGLRSAGVRIGPRVNMHTGRRLAALATSAALGQVILQGLPAWGFAVVLLEHVNDEGRPPIIELVFDDRAWALTVGTLAGSVAWAASLIALVRLMQALAQGGLRAGERATDIAVALVAILQMAFPSGVVVQSLGNVEAALRLDCERMTRLTNGVTPLVPFLLLGLARGTALVGRWRRIELHARLSAVSMADTTPALSDNAATAAFREVRGDLSTIRRILDAPLTAGISADPWLLPGLALAVLAGVSAMGSVPGSLERWGLQWLFLLAFLMTFLTIGLRVVELIGLWRMTSRLLRATADLPMVRAFDRLPTRLSVSGRSGSSASTPALSTVEAADPLIDRQFQVVVAGYRRVRPMLEARGVVTSAGDATADRLLRRPRTVGGRLLPPGRWWKAVDALLPLLAPTWAPPIGHRGVCIRYGDERRHGRGGERMARPA